MTDRHVTFLDRKRWREESRALNQQLSLGYGAGFILLLAGAYQYFMAIGSWDTLWLCAMTAGGIIVAATLIMPSVLKWPEAGLRWVGNTLGHGLMTIVLTAVYFAVIWPLGAALRARNGTDPIYEWEKTAPTCMEGWHAKSFPHDLEGTRGLFQRSRGRVGFFSVLTFFVRRGQVFFVPVLLLLVSLGIVLFFIQTSVLAPFIYTLF